jgi:hypothetical protein
MKQRILFVVWGDRVTNDEIRKRNNTKDIVALAHSLKWKWGDHLVRMD